jgi:hypothetical protein
MISEDAVRTHLIRLLDWQDAHASFDTAVGGIPPEVRGIQPAGLPYSPWQLLEHLRLTQRDKLDFCRDSAYEEPTWPEDYWPGSVAPPSEEAWEQSIAGFRADLDALKQIAAGPAPDLFAMIPHGSGQTYLRELLLVADHNAYHLGQLVIVRRLIGVW